MILYDNIGYANFVMGDNRIVHKNIKMMWSVKVALALLSKLILLILIV